jgi:dTDP-4-dehydrorhamnose reductase
MLRIMRRRDIILKEVSSDHFKETYFAPRPRSEEMRNYMLDLRSMNTMPEWRDALAEYLTENFSGSFR